VLLDEDNSPLAIQRRSPSTVTRLVEAVGDGDWNLAGHDERDGPQLKVPWSVVMEGR
jgi:hypothetical protein